ncbi:hypothetical protein SAMN05428988_5288 [Chitinophaga sp. YR573]|nr:hypothetical protein SAMN05428988_5288 [Chitinophaga sp. YR573]
MLIAINDLSVEPQFDYIIFVPDVVINKYTLSDVNIR